MPWTKRICRRRRAAGFTLIELAVVLALIALVLAIALPQFVPLIAFGRHEGAARRLAAYGREAMNYCALRQQRVVIQIDLDEQQVWCMQWPDTPIEDLITESQEEFFRNAAAGKALLGDVEAAAVESVQAAFEAALRFNDRRERSIARRMDKLAETRDEGILRDIGPLFERDFTLDDERVLEPEEVMDPLLRRVRLGEGLAIVRVEVDGETFGDGLVEVDVDPTGLSATVALFVESESGDRFVVTWDPVRAHGGFEEGG